MRQGISTVGFEQPTDFEQSPAKMFVGLFVLIGLLAVGFLVVRMLGSPEQVPPNSTNQLQTPFLDSQRSPDGSLPGERIPEEPFSNSGFGGSPSRPK